MMRYAGMMMAGIVFLSGCGDSISHAPADPYAGTPFGTARPAPRPSQAVINTVPSRPGLPGRDGSGPDHLASMVIGFAVHDSSLDQDARARLAELAVYLKAHSDVAAQVEGHADEDGSSEYNLALGAQRAGAVRDYLLLHGVPRSQITIISFGREKRLETCSVEICRASNRRVVSHVQPGAQV